MVADGDGDGETRGEDEEDSSDAFFDAGEVVVVGSDRLSLHGASESSQSGGGGGTEDDPVDPVAPGTATHTQQQQTDRSGLFITHDLVNFNGS